MKGMEPIDMKGDVCARACIHWWVHVCRKGDRQNQRLKQQ